jgi:precorrin-4 methylase
VTLVGAGPGDAELLTLKAARVLASASLVLYDHLVSKDVLQHVPTGAELIYVGKQSSNHSLPQEGIIDLMVRLAQAGRSLVRLKGGDPYIFGRGGEEAEALAPWALPVKPCLASVRRRAQRLPRAFRSPTATMPACWCLPPAICRAKARSAPWRWTGRRWRGPGRRW